MTAESMFISISHAEYPGQACIKSEVPEKIKLQISITYYLQISYRINAHFAIVTTFLAYFPLNKLQNIVLPVLASGTSVK
jgi:hypothetical protein